MRCCEEILRALSRDRALTDLPCRAAAPEEPVDGVEAPLPLRLRPVAALDDEPCFHGGELALERRLAEAFTDLALDSMSLVGSASRRTGPARGPAQAGLHTQGALHLPH